MREVALPLVKQPDQERMGLLWVDLKLPTVETQEHIGGEIGDTLVAINARPGSDAGLYRSFGKTPAQFPVLVDGSRSGRLSDDSRKVCESLGDPLI
jgi:hypothetical protein